jgi:para-nitrobenzyl esterase
LTLLTVTAIFATACNYPLKVISGSGSGYYEPGAKVNITANAPAAGYVFDQWKVTYGNPQIASISAATTVLTMGSTKAVVTATYAMGSVPPVGNGITKAETMYGDVKGFITDEGVVAFLGIPYAKPPVGELRFAPPVPGEPWEDTLNAMDFGPACPQPEIDPSDVMNWEINEDCLTLNVWTPSVDNQKRAVMFWIHGGGYIWESSGDKLYHGARMAVRGNVVVVSVEYRLGAFGFSYFEDVPGSGNAGLLDQVLALRWVRDNIAAFGGNPDNVTIWGESAGSYSVCALLGMPGAEGLFHKAIAQSGGSSTVRQKNYARRSTELLYKYAGVNTLEALRRLSWQEVMAAQEKVMEKTLLPDNIYAAVVDGTVFPEPPLHAIANGLSSNIPLIVGTTRDEGRWWMVENALLALPVATPLVTMTAFPYFKRSIPPNKTAVEGIVLYYLNYPELAASPNLVALAMMTDAFLRVPTLRHAEAQTVHQPGNVFVYRFDWNPPCPEYPLLNLGSPHGAELAFITGYPEGWPELYGEDGIPKGLQNQMMDAWASFARTGNPNHANMPEWRPYNTCDRPTMLFNAKGAEATSRLKNDPAGSTRAFWDAMPFDGVNPPLLPEDLSD